MFRQGNETLNFVSEICLKIIQKMLQKAGRINKKKQKRLTLYLEHKI